MANQVGLSLSKASAGTKSASVNRLLDGPNLVVALVPVYPNIVNFCQHEISQNITGIDTDIVLEFDRPLFSRVLRIQTIYYNPLKKIFSTVFLQK